MARGEHWSWQDADARKLTELILQRSQHYGVLFFDTDLRITGWSRGAHFITGWSDSDLLGQRTARTFVPEDVDRKLDELETLAATQMGASEDERWHLRKDGSRFWSSGVCLPLRSEAGQVNGFVKIFRDATHLRGRMKYLENELQQADASAQQRDTFIGTIAHEMRNPLSPLKMGLELLKSSPGRPGGLQDAVRLMERQVDFLERLVEDLVDLTRVRMGKLSIAYERVDLQWLVGEAIESCRRSAETKGVQLHAVLPSVSLQVEVDPQRLQQVLVNLLNNGIKFTPAGGAIFVRATVDQTHFLVSVRDDGAGIAPDLLPRIFNMFAQAEGARTHRGAGLGIGLGLVKEIVSLHLGTVEVRSDGVGKGSEFTIRIPQRQPHGSQDEPLPPASPGSEPGAA